MKEDIGDFSYNGIPMFNVGFRDFSVFLESIESNKRVLSKNIARSDLREYFIQSRHNNFGVCYEGVTLDIRKNKSSL